MRKSRIHQKAILEPDLGARCENHVGEVYPPRCWDCDASPTEPLDDLPTTEVIDSIFDLATTASKEN